jgi:hypothetical protein
LDDDGNPLETETAAQPPDRSDAGADARIASQDARRQPQDTVPLSHQCDNNAAMGSTGFGGGSSDDSSSDSSSGRDSARRSVSSRRRRRRKQRRSKGRSDPPWIHLVTGTSSLIASLSARSNRDVAGKVLLKARHGRIILLSRPRCSLILIHMCTFHGWPHTLLMVICYAIL